MSLESKSGLVSDEKAEQEFRHIRDQFPLGPQHLANNSVTADQIAAGAVGTSEAPTFVNSTVENMKVIRGTYTTAGGSYATSLGSGFTGARNGVGDVTITFSAAFSAVPTITATAGHTAALLLAKIGGAAGNVAPTTTTVDILLVTAGGVATDGIVNFIVIGPR